MGGEGGRGSLGRERNQQGGLQSGGFRSPTRLTVDARAWGGRGGLAELLSWGREQRSFLMDETLLRTQTSWHLHGLRLDVA